MNNSIESIARHYFDLSNKALLKDIRKLFAEDATYSSVVTGLYFGIDDIMKMMTSFFSQYKTLHWTIHDLKIITDNIVEIRFSLQATEQSGEHFKRLGIEKLVINRGKIRHIEIKTDKNMSQSITSNTFCP